MVRGSGRPGCCFTIEGKTIHEFGQLNFDELHAFLGTVKPAGRGADAGRQVLKEIRGRLELLLGIGSTTSTSTVARARFPAASRSGSACPRRSGRG